MKVIIAIDGSRFGDEAIDYCKRLLGPHDAGEIKLISVIQRLEPLGSEKAEEASQYYAQLQNFSQEQASEFITKGANRLKEEFSGRNFDVSEEILRGSVSREIIRYAEEWKADLIVLGSHGYGYWERTLLGSVSDSIVHLAPCSVLIVRSVAGQKKP